MESLEQLYEKYSRPLYRFLLSMTGSSQDAEELLQETFYQALIHIENFEGRCSPLTWLCQIGKFLWFKELGKRKRYHNQPVDKIDIPKEERILENVVEKEEKSGLRRAIADLKEPYREVVILHIYGERSLKEIAATFEKSESWARVTFYRAKQILSEKMKEGEKK